MTKILDFTYRGKPYTIYDVDKIEGKDSYIGETNYDNGRILVERGSRQEMLDTLKHELAHCYIWEYGFYYVEADEETICEIVAKSNDFINRVVDKYRKETKKGGDTNDK